MVMTSLTAIHEVAESWRQVWREGRRPSLEACLGDHAKLDVRELLRALLAVEIHERQLQGEQVGLDELLGRFPHEVGVIREVFHETVHSRRDDTGIGRVLSAEVGSAAEHDAIGRYKVIRELGSGGFGTVLHAFDPMTDRPVAIKLAFASKFSSRHQMEIWLREAKRTGKFTHNKGIVTIYDFIVLDDRVGPSSSVADPPVCAIVMEYLDGGTLADELRYGRLSCERAAEIVCRVAEALNEPHSHDIIHRDLKPDNILLNSSGEPVISDFGLAIHEDSQLARHNELAGTHAYMSPEQIRGDRLDARSDVWSLGVVFYEMLTGCRPFEATGRELSGQILSETPHAPRDLDDEIPIELERVCLRCLEKEPQRRLTARRLSDDVGRWLGSGAMLTGGGRQSEPDQREPMTATRRKPLAAPAPLTPWERLDVEERRAIGQLMGCLQKGSFVELRSLLEGIRRSSASVLLRAVLRFCEATTKLKLDLTANNPAQLRSNLAACLDAWRCPTELYTTYPDFVRQALKTLVQLLFLVVVRQDDRHEILRAVKEFAAENADDSFFRELDVLGYAP